MKTLIDKNDYVVYRHTSPSGKVYIGITCTKPERRWRNGNGYKSCPKFYNAIQKYGWDNFKHEILFSGLNEISAKHIEEDLVYYYKKQNISYNITDGGDGTRGVSPSEETRKKISERTREAMKNSDIRKKISNAKKGKPINYILNEDQRKKLSKRMKINNPTKNGLSEKWRNNIGKASSKSVNQFSLDGKLIATYSSITEASKSIKRDGGNISRCCNGKLKTVGGFIWRFNEN